MQSSPAVYYKMCILPTIDPKLAYLASWRIGFLHLVSGSLERIGTSGDLCIELIQAVVDTAFASVLPHFLSPNVDTGTVFNHCYELESM